MISRRAFLLGTAATVAVGASGATAEGWCDAGNVRFVPGQAQRLKTLDTWYTEGFVPLPASPYQLHQVSMSVPMPSADSTDPIERLLAERLADHIADCKRRAPEVCRSIFDVVEDVGERPFGVLDAVRQEREAANECLWASPRDLRSWEPDESAGSAVFLPRHHGRTATRTPRFVQDANGFWLDRETGKVWI